MPSARQLHVAEAIPIFKDKDPLPVRYTIECSARDLDRKDLTTSDPYFVVYSRPFPSVSKPYHFDLKREPLDPSLAPIYKSEVKKHELKPVWNSFDINVADLGGYDNEILVQVWDHERSGTHNLIGEFRLTVRELLMPVNEFRVAHPKKSYSRINPGSGVFIFNSVVSASPVPQTPPCAFSLYLKAEKVERKDMMGLAKSDPFLTFVARPYGYKSPIRVHRTETILNSRSPEWRPFRMDIARYGGLDSMIDIECWDQDSKGRAKFIGRCSTTLRELSFYKSNNVIALINPKKKGRVGYTHSGLIYIIDCQPEFPAKDFVERPQNYQDITFDGSDKIAVSITGGIPMGVAHNGVNLATPTSHGVPMGTAATTSVPPALGGAHGTPQSSGVHPQVHPSSPAHSHLQRAQTAPGPYNLPQAHPQQSPQSHQQRPQMHHAHSYPHPPQGQPQTHSPGYPPHQMQPSQIPQHPQNRPAQPYIQQTPQQGHAHFPQSHPGYAQQQQGYSQPPSGYVQHAHSAPQMHAPQQSYPTSPQYGQQQAYPQQQGYPQQQPPPGYY